MFLIMALGVFLRTSKMLSPSTIKEINIFTIKFLFPALFFVQMSQMDIVSVFDGKFILATLAVLALTYLLSWLTAIVMTKDKRRKVAITQLIYVANLVVVGIPMVESALPKQYAPFSILVLFFALFFHNIIPITQFEMVSGREEKQEPLYKIILRVFKNPIVASIIIAALLNMFNLFVLKMDKFPLWVFEKPLSQLGHAASTIVFLCIGYNMKFHIEVKSIKYLAVMSLVSLVVIPVFTYGIAAAFGVDKNLALVLTIMFASPTAPYIYNIMLPYDLELDLTQHTVVVTMIGYLITMPLILLALGL